MKTISAATKKTTKYSCILASVRELGVIEPLIVYPDDSTAGRYMLLDGHSAAGYVP